MAQLIQLQQKLEQMIIKDDDQIAIYPICVDCYIKIRYIPSLHPDYRAVHVFE